MSSKKVEDVLGVNGSSLLQKPMRLAQELMGQCSTAIITIYHWCIKLKRA